MKFLLFMITGIILLCCDYCYAQKEDDNPVFYIVEQMPSFPGGQDSLRSFINNNTHFPQSAVSKGLEDSVYVSFVVMEDGKVDLVKIARGKIPVFNMEAMRVVKSMPRWEPGMQDGKKVRVSFTLPFIFRNEYKDLYRNYIVTTQNDTVYGVLSGYFTSPLKDSDVTVGKKRKEKKTYSASKISSIQFNGGNYLPRLNFAKKEEDRKIYFMRVILRDGDYLLLEGHGDEHVVDDDVFVHGSSAGVHYAYRLYKGSEYICSVTKKNFREIVERYFSSCSRFAREVKYNSKLKVSDLEALYNAHCN